MSLAEQYKQKLISAEEAAKLVQPGDWLDYGSFNGQVRAIDAALAKRKDELQDVKVWSCVNPYPTAINEVDPLGETFIWHSWHFSGRDRAINKTKPVYYSSIIYSELPRYCREHIEPLALAFLQVAPMDKHGYFNFGPQCTHTRAVCDRASKIVVEVNTKMPRCLGGYEEAIHISEVDFIVEGENPPLAQIPAPPLSDVDEKIAAYILNEMQDGACVQLGIGGIPNAVGMMIAQSDLKDLGCHTEMLVDAYVHMHEAGVLSGKKKQIDPGKMVCTFALGTQLLYDFIDDNPDCAFYPVNYTNKPTISSLNDNLITINNAVEVDLYGQACSESSGIRHISGTGGQFDFVMAGYMSKGGKSFLCMPATKVGKDGNLKSRIVPNLPPGGIVTDTRSMAPIMVTEFGTFSQKGMSVWQRAEGLIGIAHPDFRDDLVKAAEANGIWKKSNKIK